ncbi:hypothetical protein [Lentzea sp. NPDC060358]|uniref:hypothetical protein n=1 Tax=Lentzea sp. NPDC060358 TaxID=3347103 RepID=UPI0036507F89
MNDYTVGVEREFLLVDPGTRRPVPLAAQARSVVDPAGCRRQDTGCASRRRTVWSRRPVSGPPPHRHSPEHYDGTADAFVHSQALIGRAMACRDVRPSAERPIAAVRVADPHTGELSRTFGRAVVPVDHTGAVLRERGTLSTVERQIDRLRHNGCVAARPRRHPDPQSLVDDLIARTREET